MTGLNNYSWEQSAMECPRKMVGLVLGGFLLPVLGVFAWNYQSIRDDLTPRPQNGYLIYVTADL